MTPLDLNGTRAGSSLERPRSGLEPAKIRELGEEAPDNWVAYFDRTHSRVGLRAGVLLVSPNGQRLKYVVQLTFSWESCAYNTTECEGLLAGLRIAAGLGMTHLAVRGDSQVTSDQAGGACMSPLMKAYMGEMHRLERCFSSLELEHVSRGQDAIIKELSQIASKGLLILAGVFVEKQLKPSAIPEAEGVARAPSMTTSRAPRQPRRVKTVPEPYL
jgi:hypothetical protein